MDGELECSSYNKCQKSAQYTHQLLNHACELGIRGTWTKKSRAIELWKLEARRTCRVTKSGLASGREEETKRRRDYADARPEISGRLSAFEAISRLIHHWNESRLVPAFW
jgi:hypothetical protein